MEPFEEAVRKGDAAPVRALLSQQPELRAAIDRPLFDTAPAIVFSRQYPMVDTLLDFGADNNTDFGSAEVQALLRRHAARSAE